MRISREAGFSYPAITLIASGLPKYTNLTRTRCSRTLSGPLLGFVEFQSDLTCDLGNQILPLYGAELG